MQKKVLIVDDEPLVRYSLIKGLQVIGLDVKAVASGEEAVEEIKSCFYDMCFLDINLPGLSGFEVLKMTRDLSPDTKIFIMSGAYVDNETTMAMAGGADHFITKPFNISQIRTIARQALWGEDFAAKYRQPGSTVPDEKRKSERKPVVGQAVYSLSILDCEGMEWPAQGCELVDISEEGIGIKTLKPVEANCVCRIQKGSEQKTGVVRWAEKTPDEEIYRAGIEFL